MYCVYHQDKTFCFTSAPPAGSLTLDSGREEITPANLIEKIGNNNMLWVVSQSPEETFGRFCEQFDGVMAAGGVVRNGSGQILMIFRRGWWDLPKGHVEEGESPLQAALREVREETGLENPEPGELICRTMHFYDDYGRWELKTTWWYGMDYSGHGPLAPQITEDIKFAGWLSGDALDSALQSAYPTVREVARKYLCVRKRSK